jgi:hypothetical protein
MTALIEHSELALLVSAKEAARILAISTRKLWTETNCGAIPSIRIGRAVRYAIVDLHAYIDASRTENQTSRVSRNGGGK